VNFRDHGLLYTYSVKETDATKLGTVIV
jgi:hypothetical protein